MVYKYRVYGMNISSEVKIIEFIERYSEEDSLDVVTIKYGEIPDKYKKKIDEGTHIEINKKEVWFNIKDVGFYYISEGNTIIIKVYSDANMITVKNYLTCSCLGFIMLQREKVAMHGAVININEEGIIITGDRGAGKSSLSTALRVKGYGFVADDVAAISMKEVAYINHAFPYQKLCSDLVENMNYNKEEFISFKSDNSIKYLIPVKDKFQKDDIKLNSIFKLEVNNTDDIYIKEVKGSEKLKLILDNIYREEYIEFMGGMSPSYIQKCVKIAGNIKAYIISRPNNKFTLEEQIELVENQLELNNRVKEEVFV